MLHSFAGWVVGFERAARRWRVFIASAILPRRRARSNRKVATGKPADIYLLAYRPPFFMGSKLGVKLERRLRKTKNSPTGVYESSIGQHSLAACDKGRYDKIVVDSK
ncbi:hypothetical protein PhaeoP57_00008 [Phaeobacter inhibens]|nr:hypothetical protein PhaeoP51_00008 [Phaeobacter inhibens]AUQ80982.1 hypothetical protein PhaeoP57_00008 [Phaeobacter inhibens]AUQ88670.1 hypothetical protein PhaeoP24_00008 [Phaeobacter inhibens]